jgi:hypothetical protein
MDDVSEAVGVEGEEGEEVFVARCRRNFRKVKGDFKSASSGFLEGGTEGGDIAFLSTRSGS